MPEWGSNAALRMSVKLNNKTQPVPDSTTRGEGDVAQWLKRLASHAWVPVLNPAVPVWGFQKISIVSPFSM